MQSFKCTKLSEFWLMCQQAMHLAAAAWESVGSDTITKCFRKAGIGIRPNSEDVDGQDMSLEDLDVGELPDNWELIGNGQDYGNFVRYDEQLAVCGMQSIQDLVNERERERREESSEEENEAEIPPPVPSFAEALRAYEAATRFLTSHVLSDAEVRVIADFGRLMYKSHSSSPLKQKTINDYFDK